MNEGGESDSGSPQSGDAASEDSAENEAPQTSASIGTKPKKKGKKKKKKNQSSENLDEDFLLEVVPSGDQGFSAPKTGPMKSVLNLEQKNLNSDNELKKIFGSKVVTAGQKKKARGRAYVKSTWLINAKDNWNQIRKTGLSMSLDHTKDGCFYFKYEHNKEYRQIQFNFWDSVSSMNPANIVVSFLIFLNLNRIVINKSYYLGIG